jgi:hypothetical protein
MYEGGTQKWIMCPQEVFGRVTLTTNVAAELKANKSAINRPKQTDRKKNDEEAECEPTENKRLDR